MVKYKKSVFLPFFLFFIISSSLLIFINPSLKSTSSIYFPEDDLINFSDIIGPETIEIDNLTANVILEIDNNTLRFKEVNEDNISCEFCNVTINLSNGSIITNETTTGTLETIPDDSIVAKLPDDKIMVKLPNQTIEVFNGGETVTDIPGSYIIRTNNIGIFITDRKIPKLTDELDKSFKDINVSTKIETLNEYKLTFTPKELSDSINIMTGSEELKIYWGDGTYTVSELNDLKITHTYKKSGKYSINISIDSLYYSANSTREVYISEPELIDLPVLIIKTYPEETAVVTSAGIGTATLIGFIATETGKYKLFYLLSLAIPLYTRVQKEDILDQFVRGQIYAIIKTNPGIHYNKIMEKIDVKNGTLSYHLHMLEKTDMIKSRKEGFRYRAFYTSDIKFPKDERYRLTELQTKIIDIIKSKEGIPQKEIAEKLKEKPQTISYNLKVLQQADLVKMNKKGRKKRCYLGDNFSNNQKESP